MSAGQVVVVGDAIREMKSRGIGNPSELLNFAAPESILEACRWWDTQRSAGAGVLAKLIRSGGIEPPARSEAEESRCPRTSQLDSEWAQIKQRIGESDDERNVMLHAPWLQALHPHAHDSSGWTLAAEQWAVGYLYEKGRLSALRKAIGQAVHLTICAAGER